MSDTTDERLAFEHGFDAGFLAGAAAMRERAAKVCEEYADQKWSEYKTGNWTTRANPEIQGNSNGAQDCADIIRALPLTEDK